MRGARKPAPVTRGAKFAQLVGVNRRSGKTDQLMALLRGYDEDIADPGLK